MQDQGCATYLPAAPPPAPLRLGPLKISPTWLAFAQFAVITLAFRLVLFGNPLVHGDEEFYLLVADRWQHGALPYVDIWDRKPIGLFLLYRFFDLFPFDPVYVYQSFAVLATAGTSLLIQRMGREIAPHASSWWAGLVYSLAMPGFTCVFGQSPVFYNLLMAMAALQVVACWKQARSSGLMLRGLSVMALVGLALQIKYSVVFEGVAFGLLLLARGWFDAWSWTRLALAGLVWAAVALAPTVLAYGAYVMIGHGSEFVQANFTSILLRSSEGGAAWARLAEELLALTPFWLAVAVAPCLLAMPELPYPRVLVVLRLWAGAALLGFLAFGTWYDHYAAPMLCPLSVLSAPVFGRAAPRARWFARILVASSFIGAVLAMGVRVHNHGDARDLAQLTAQVRRELHGGCFYQFDGEAALYRTVGACIPTRFAFPYHLTTWTEARALGTDQVGEVARIMHTRPAVVMIIDAGDDWQPNLQARETARLALGRDYQRYARIALGEHVYSLYRLRRP